MDTKETGFENGGRVPITTPEELANHGDQQAPDDLELRFDFSESDQELICEEVDNRVRQELHSAQAEAIRAVLFLIKDAKKPRRAVYQLLYKCGAGAACGGSASAIARKFNITKQAFEQEADRNFASLDLRKSPLEKSDEAREKYSKTNFRKLTQCQPKPK